MPQNPPLIPSSRPLSAAALESSTLSVFSCPVLAASMSWIDSKQLFFYGHFDFQEEPKSHSCRFSDSQWTRWKGTQCHDFTHLSTFSLDTVTAAAVTAFFLSHPIRTLWKEDSRAALESGKNNEISGLKMRGTYGNISLTIIIFWSETLYIRSTVA